MKLPDLKFNNPAFLVGAAAIAGLVAVSVLSKQKASVNPASLQSYFLEQGSFGRADLENYLNTVPTQVTLPIPKLYERITIAEWNGPCI
ncbi:MAG: hypothetical protein DA328_07940 [Nitrososphaeraceae archaeon]|nr:hypothetical protein [Nitrososphaeraceae archaeon]